MKLPKTEIKTLKLAKLKPAEYNPRKISDDARKGLTQSISKFGLVQPIIWNKKTGNIVGGHQRYDVLKEQNIQETDVVVVDLNDLDEKALNIALNSPAIEGEFVNDRLQTLLEEIKSVTPQLYEDLQFADLVKNLNLTPLVSPEEASKDALPAGKFLVVAACPDEKAQLELIEKLSETGYECKALMA